MLYYLAYWSETPLRLFRRLSQALNLPKIWYGKKADSNGDAPYAA